MLIDCDSCAVRGAACSGCLVSALLDAPLPGAGLTGDEQRAVELLARAGFDVEILSATAPAPLRLVPGSRRRRHARRPRAA
jgi:hypothetical protein